MKIDPHLPQLPSIGELLEHPRVKAVVARINQSTVAQRATGFLDELRSSLSKRAGLGSLSVTHLAERLARRLLGEPTAGPPLVNATGCVLGDPELTLPLADSAAHAMMHVTGEYHSSLRSGVDATEQELCRLTGAESALIVNKYESALTLLLSAVAQHREVAIYAVDREADQTDWQWIAARAGLVLRNAAGAAASSHEPTDSLSKLAAIVVSTGLLSGDDADVAATLTQLSAGHAACLIDAAPLAGIIDPARHGLQSIPTLSERLKRGADVVATDGAGLLGGPSCGILLGKRRSIEAAANHPLASLLSMEPASVAALQATLTSYSLEKGENALFTVPVWQLLSTPLPNLQQRAERLASLMNDTPMVQSAAARELVSPWIRSGAGSLSASSWAVALTPRTGDVAQLVERLQLISPAIMAQQAEDAVLLDLRGVFPRWDQQLVAAVEGRAATSAEAESVQAL